MGSLFWPLFSVIQLIWSLHLPLHLGPFFFGTCSKNQNWNLLGFLQGIKYSKAWSVNSLTVWMYVVNAINVQIFVFVMLKPITYILLTSPDFTEENFAIFVSLILSWWIFFFFVVVFDNYNIYLQKKLLTLCNLLVIIWYSNNLGFKRILTNALWLYVIALYTP